MTMCLTSIPGSTNCEVSLLPSSYLELSKKQIILETKLYIVPILIQGKIYMTPCYGMDKRTDTAMGKDSYRNLCSKFNVNSTKLMERLTSINMLIYMEKHTKCRCIKTSLYQYLRPQFMLDLFVLTTIL